MNDNNDLKSNLWFLIIPIAGLVYIPLVGQLYIHEVILFLLAICAIA